MLKIFNRTSRICQFGLWVGILFFFNGCGVISFIRDAAWKKDIPVVKAIPVWQRVPKRFAPRDEVGRFLPHGFFDLLPFPGMKDNTVNFVATVPQEGRFRYRMDMVSGNLYRTHSYCSRRDTSKEYSGKLYRPPYTEGFIPRLLDQEKKPQEIIVFGAKKYFTPFDKNASTSQRVRIIGGVIKTRCSTFPCKSDRSISSIVLVAVNPLDDDLVDVKEIADLKDEVDWEEAVAFMRNSDGDFYIGRKYHPAWRIKGEIPARQALKMALKKGHLFTFKELKTMQSACHRLYDYLWRSFQKIKNDEKNDSHFSDFFGDFYETYHRRMNICTKYVSFSNIIENPKRHWFFTGIDLFFKLEKIGLSYSCAKRAWVKKRTDSTLSSRYGKCTKGQIERSFTNGISVLRSLSLTRQNHYRYISYDKGAGASNQKLYSWIPVSDLQLSCSSDRRIQSVFPHDIAFEDYF